MATPVKREELARLESLGGEEMVFAWLAEGKTLTSLADTIDVSRQILSQYCNRKERKERYLAARKEGASAFMEQGLTLVDSANPDDVQVKKLQSDYRRMYAGKLDHDAWGDKNQAGTVNINLNSLHLDAVKQLSNPKQAEEDWLDAIEGEIVEDDWLE